MLCAVAGLLLATAVGPVDGGVGLSELHMKPKSPHAVALANSPHLLSAVANSDKIQRRRTHPNHPPNHRRDRRLTNHQSTTFDYCSRTPRSSTSESFVAIRSSNPMCFSPVELIRNCHQTVAYSVSTLTTADQRVSKRGNLLPLRPEQRSRFSPQGE
jgi:hypothetical protein